MDAVIQAETADVRAIVTNTCVIIFQGRIDDSQVFAWTTVTSNIFELLKNSIETNAPNSSSILV